MTKSNLVNDSCFLQHSLSNDQIPVVLTDPADMPWPVKSPFRMLPGMARFDSALFSNLSQDDAYRQAKRTMFEAGYGRVGQADVAVLELLARRYQEETGIAINASLKDLVGGLPEDFVILHDETDDLPDQE